MSTVNRLARLAVVAGSAFVPVLGVSTNTPAVLFRDTECLVPQDSLSPGGSGACGGATVPHAVIFTSQPTRQTTLGRSRHPKVLLRRAHPTATMTTYSLTGRWAPGAERVVDQGGARWRPSGVIAQACTPLTPN
jgi:hypothetical protein